MALSTTCPLLLALSLSTHAGPPATNYELTLVDGGLPGIVAFPELPIFQLNDINDHGLATWTGLTLDPDYFSNFIVIQAAGLYDAKKEEFVTLWQGEFDDVTGDTISTTGVYPFGLNNRGELVTGDDCSYVTRKGEVIQLTHPLYGACSTRGIASNGAISGYTIDDAGIWRGFVYDPKNESLCIGIINHLFRQSDKYQLPCSGPRCDPDAPCTTEIVIGKALHAVPTVLDDSIP